MIAEPLRSLVVPIDSLNLDPANARLHPERNLDAIKGSLSRFGQRKPIIVRANGRIVMAGNGLLTAAKALGWTEIAAVILDDDAITATAYALADNRTAELAEWDDEVLPRLMDELIQAGEHPANMGWDDDEIATLLNQEKPEIDAAPRIDEAEALREKWGVERGQIWTLGKHRIMCGDSTKAEDVDELMNGESAILMHTDPPYGVDYANVLVGRENQKEGGWKDIAGDDLSDDDLQNLLRDAFRLTQAKVAFIWHSWKRIEVVLRAVRDVGFKPASEIVWVKNALVFGRSDYQWRHECCIYAKREGAGKQDDRTATTVWEFPKTTQAMHPTQKPVGLFEIPIENHTNPGDICYEPFSGSGSQILAAEALHRRCFAMEISPAYVAVAIQRWADATGGTPLKVETPQTQGAM